MKLLRRNKLRRKAKESRKLREKHQKDTNYFAEIEISVYLGITWLGISPRLKLWLITYFCEIIQKSKIKNFTPVWQCGGSIIDLCFEGSEKLLIECNFSSLFTLMLRLRTDTKSRNLLHEQCLGLPDSNHIWICFVHIQQHRKSVDQNADFQPTLQSTLKYERICVHMYVSVCLS